MMIRSDLFEYDDPCVEYIDREDFYGGDPRRCPRHSHVTTSSPDGLFDAPCGECEAEMDADREGEPTAAETFGYLGGADDAPTDRKSFAPFPPADDDIPF